MEVPRRMAKLKRYQMENTRRKKNAFEKGKKETDYIVKEN